MAELGKGTHLDLDDAWGDLPVAMPRLDVRKWGPALRYIARTVDIETFWGEVGSRLEPYVLYGSGDYHFLAALFLRQFEAPLTLVSFDNHPDWDVRPPRWACGGWVNRALERSNVERASVWGCGNFEPAMPSRLFANHAALRSGRLEVHPWSERMPRSARRRFACITRDTWRQQFVDFAASLDGKSVYVTVDLDCLATTEAITNWESGLFAASDVAWALRLLRERACVVGGDLCGAYSAPQYSRPFQRLAGRWDHPKLASVIPETARRINHSALLALWPALSGG